MFSFLVITSSSPNTADVPHVIISVTMFSVSSLLLVGTVLYLVMFSDTAFSGSVWFRGRNRVTEPLAWLMARNWTVSAVKSATCTPSMSTVYCSVGLPGQSSSFWNRGHVHRRGSYLKVKHFSAPEGLPDRDTDITMSCTASNHT